MHTQRDTAKRTSKSTRRRAWACRITALEGVAALALLAAGQRAAAADAPAARQEEEIIVSARRRDERLIDVPASIQVMGAQQLVKANIEDVTGMVGRVPGLGLSANTLSPGRDFMNIVIRGVGAQSVGSPAVGTFIDGVYTPGMGFDMDFLDVERVEVLKGPQGTLFGRNTEGGALSIVTRKPSQDFSGKIMAGYDNFNTFDGRASVTGPIASDLAGSLAIGYSHTDGYIRAAGIESLIAAQAHRNVGRISADDMRSVMMRGALRWWAGEETEINFSADFSDKRGHEPFPGIPIGGLAKGRGHPQAMNGRYAVMSEFQMDAHYQNYGAALTIDQGLGFAKLTSITGYRELTSDSPFDFDGGTDLRDNFYEWKQMQRSFSQELRLAGDAADNRISWLVGAYGFIEKNRQRRFAELPTIPTLTGISIDRQDQRIKSHGYAAFGQVSWKPVEPLELTAGLRYSWEKSTSDYNIHYRVPNLLGPGVDFELTDRSHRNVSFDNVSPTASIRYAVTGGLSIYARYAKGFRAGGFGPAPGDDASNLPYKAETSENYEAGIKGDLFGRMLSFDIAGFYIDLSDQQLQTIVRSTSGVPLAAVANAGKSRSKGFEGSLTVRPIDGLSVSGNVGYTDAYYIVYIDAAGKSRAGEAFPFVPKWTASGDVEYSWNISEDWSASVGGSYSYFGKMLSGTGVDTSLQFALDGYDRIDLRAGVSYRNLTLDVYAQNITDNYNITRIFNSFFFPDPPARPFAVVAPPRQIGGRLTWKF